MLTKKFVPYRYFVQRTPQEIREKAALTLVRMGADHSDEIKALLGKIAMRVRRIPCAGFLGTKRQDFTRVVSKTKSRVKTEKRVKR